MSFSCAKHLEGILDEVLKEAGDIIADVANVDTVIPSLKEKCPSVFKTDSEGKQYIECRCCLRKAKYIVVSDKVAKFLAEQHR